MIHRYKISSVVPCPGLKPGALIHDEKDVDKRRHIATVALNKRNNVCKKGNKL